MFFLHFLSLMSSFFYSRFPGTRRMSNMFIRKDQVLEFLIEIGNEQQDNPEGNEGEYAVQRIEIREIVEKNFGDGEAEHND